MEEFDSRSLRLTFLDANGLLGGDVLVSLGAELE